MLTQKQQQLLLFIHRHLSKTGVSPSFDEMKDALNLASKSGIHRLISALEERGFIRRLAYRARALEVLKLPNISFYPDSSPTEKNIIEHDFSGNLETKQEIPGNVPVLGRIAAGVPISAIQHEVDRVTVPDTMIDKSGEHFALEVSGDSMIDLGILNGDLIVVRRSATADTGDVVVALINDEEATLKILRKRGSSIALEAANPAYETRIFSRGEVCIQGRLVGLVRKY